MNGKSWDEIKMEPMNWIQLNIDSCVPEDSFHVKAQNEIPYALTDVMEHQAPPEAFLCTFSGMKTLESTSDRYMMMEVCGASLSCGVRRAAWTNVRRECLYRVDVRVAIGARLVVSIRSYSSHVTDKGLKNEHYRCDPVAVRRLGQGWARNAPTYTHAHTGLCVGCAVSWLRVEAWAHSPAHGRCHRRQAAGAMARPCGPHFRSRPRRAPVMPDE